MATHFKGPVLHKDAAGTWSRKLPIGVDPDYIVWFRDFETTYDATNDFVTVKDSGAAVAIAADAIGGELTLTSAATTDNDGVTIQSIQESFKLESGKRLWFKCRVKNSDADQTDLFAGLCRQIATNPENVLTDGDRMGFQIDDGGASIYAIAEKDGTETKTDTGSDLADNTYIELGMYWDGNGSVEYYVDDLLKTTVTTNIQNDENLAATMFHLSGDATGTRTSTWDYILVVKER